MIQIYQAQCCSITKRNVALSPSAMLLSHQAQLFSCSTYDAGLNAIVSPWSQVGCRNDVQWRNTLGHRCHHGHRSLGSGVLPGRRSQGRHLGRPVLRYLPPGTSECLGRTLSCHGGRSAKHLHCRSLRGGRRWPRQPLWDCPRSCLRRQEGFVRESGFGAQGGRSTAPNHVHLDLDQLSLRRLTSRPHSGPGWRCSRTTPSAGRRTRHLAAAATQERGEGGSREGGGTRS